MDRYRGVVTLNPSAAIYSPRDKLSLSLIEVEWLPVTEIVWKHQILVKRLREPAKEQSDRLHVFR